MANRFTNSKVKKNIRRTIVVNSLLPALAAEMKSALVESDAVDRYRSTMTRAERRSLYKMD